MEKADFTNRLCSYRNDVLNYARHLAGNDDDAQDIAQETIYMALKNQNNYRMDQNLRGWLLTIARNLFINQYRRSKKFVKVAPDHEGDKSWMFTRIPEHVEADHYLHLKEAKNAIEELQEDKRIPFVMHVEGYKYKEIAQDIGLPIGTVKSRINGARKILHGRLQAA